MRKMLLPSVPPPQPRPPPTAFRAFTETPCRRGRCFQMGPDAETWGGGWPPRSWKGGEMKEAQEMSEEGV